VIHYHGCPITPRDAAIQVLARRHACISYAHPAQVELAAEVCQSFILDNGAFSAWKQGGSVNVELFAEWVTRWHRHPGYDWCLIPDVIDGTEAENDRMLGTWLNAYGSFAHCVPVWHMHESVARLARLCRTFPRVALGSSGEFATVGTPAWWGRMAEAMDAVTDVLGGKIPIDRLVEMGVLGGDSALWCERRGEWVAAKPGEGHLLVEVYDIEGDEGVVKVGEK
jgi:hypothetical protein